MKYKSYITILSLFLLSSIVSAQGYEITVKAPQFANTNVVLAEYFTSRMVPKDTVHLNAKGIGTIQGEEAFKGGLYVLYFNAKHYLDFMIDVNQKFTITTDTTSFTEHTTFSGSPNNTLFYDYKNYLSESRKIQEKQLEKLKDAKTEKDSSKIRDKATEINKEISAGVDQYIEGNEGLFFSTFLKSMKEPSPAEDLIVGSKREKDSIRYMYLRHNYFENFDIGDIRLLHSPIYDPKIKTYINRYVPQHPDSLIIAVDMLMEKAASNEEIFRYMLITLFNNFAESKMMGMDKVYFHIAEKYYIPKATWSSKDFIDKLQENLDKSRHTFINNPAPDFQLIGIPKEHIHMAEMDTSIKSDPHVGFRFNLYEIPGEYTLLYFWEADCGHCKKSTPKLYEVFEKYKDQNVSALSVHVINSVEGKVKWMDFLNEYGLYDWINCWSPYDNNFRDLYNLQSFPQLFLLDKNKKIVAKMLSPEQADDILGKFLTEE